MSNHLLELIISVTVGMVILAVAITFILPDESPITMQYDDYIEVSGDVETSGPLEIVEINGIKYVHATDVGTGSINANNQHKTVTVNKAELDVYLITGQSNSGNFAYDTNKVEIPDFGTAYYYGTYDRSLCYWGWTPTVYASTPCDMFPVTSDIVGKAMVGDKNPNFAKTYYEVTGHKTYWICGGIGGVSITSFVSGGELYTYNASVINDAISKVDTDKFNINIRDYIWIQGENDATLDVNTYKTIFTAFNTALTTNSGYCDVVFNKCWISLMPEIYPNSRQAQIELSEELDNVEIATDAANKFTVANGCLAEDGVHYSQKGDNIISAALVNKCVSNVSDPIPANSDIKFDKIPSIVSVIPVVIIVAILMSIVGVIIRSRTD